MKKGIVLFIITLMLMTIGCKQDDTDSLTIGVMADVGASPFVLAQAEGYFESLGLDVEIKVFRSALDRDAALQSGALDGAMADMLTIFFYNQSDFNVKMTSATYGDYIMVSSPEVDHDAFLSNEKISIGLSSHTVIDFATDLVAREMGFVEKLDKVVIPQMPVRLEMLGSGQLTGATLPDPLAAAAELKGTRIGSTMDYNLKPGIFIMNQSAIDEKSEAIDKLYEGYNQGVEYINTHDIDAYFDSLESTLGFPAALRDTYKMPVFEKASQPDEATFDAVQSWMTDNELLERTFDFQELTDLSFIQ